MFLIDTIIVIIIFCTLIIYSIDTVCCMGQILKLVCICECVSLCVYLSVGTVTITFIDRFSRKLALTQEPQK